MVISAPLRVVRAKGAQKGKEKAMSPTGTIIRGEGEGERRWFAGGGLWTMKATAEETGGAFILVEDQMTLGKMTPLHTHPNQDETLIVLEGEILVHAEGREHRVGPRGVAVALRGAPHAFMVTSERAPVHLPLKRRRSPPQEPKPRERRKLPACHSLGCCG